MAEAPIAVGSTNPAKVGAVEAVMQQAFPGCPVVAVAAASGVSAQPMGIAETEQGARARAAGALSAAPGAWLGIGLEGGIALTPAGGDLINCCAIAAANGRVTVAWGVRFPLPPAAVAAVRAGDELGPVMDRLSGIPLSKDRLGAVGILTNGLLTREQMWQPVIACALAPHLHPELYPAENAVTRDYTVATFVVDRGRVLLLWHRKLQMWLPPGGHIEAGELPDTAAVREVLEETGLKVELVSAPTITGIPGPRPLARPEGVQLEDIHPGHQHIDLIYFARPAGGTEPVLNQAESEAVGWFSPADFARLGLTAEVRAWADRALAVVGGRTLM